MVGRSVDQRVSRGWSAGRWSVDLIKPLLRWVFPKQYRRQYRNSPSKVFLGKGVLKVWSNFTGEHPCQSAISITLLKSHFGMSILL